MTDEEKKLLKYEFIEAHHETWSEHFRGQPDEGGKVESYRAREGMVSI